MGGSGIIGDVFSSSFQNIISIHSDQIPQTFVNKNNHYIIVSYSGNTKETISAFEQIKDYNHTIISSGGILGRENNVIEVPNGYVPRDAFEIMFKTTYETLSKMIDLPEYPTIQNPEDKEIEKMMACFDKTPIIYSHETLKPLSYRLKTQINENIKKHAFCNVLPEMSHNEIEAKNHDAFSTILFKSKHNKYVEAWEKAVDFEYTTFNLKGQNLLEQILYGIRLSDLATVKYSKQNNIQRIETPYIQNFKEHLNQKLE